MVIGEPPKQLPQLTSVSPATGPIYRTPDDAVSVSIQVATKDKLRVVVIIGGVVANQLGFKVGGTFKIDYPPGQLLIAKCPHSYLNFISRSGTKKPDGRDGVSIRITVNAKNVVPLAKVVHKIEDGKLILNLTEPLMESLNVEV